MMESASRIARIALAGLVAASVSCSRNPPPADTGHGTIEIPRGARAPGAADASANAEAHGGDPPIPANVSRCESASPGLSCLLFPSAEEAVRWLLGFEPTILAVGEAHALKGTESVDSSTKRFTEQLLPVLAPRASDLVVELWAPDARCDREVKQVQTAQKAVTTAQAASNPNEYVALGTRAKERGVTPWLLRPTCDDFAMLADAGPDAVGAMLALVKRLTLAKIVALHERNRKEARSLVLAYGGALHNDVAPENAATKEYSFGPELAALEGARYVELDLIVPEFVKDTPAWQKLPWYATFRASPPERDRATLYRSGAGAFTIVFPAARPK